MSAPRDEFERLPMYRCHKVVRAAKILAIGSYGLRVDAGDPQICLTLRMPDDWLERHRPEVGGYLVVYEDGYKSYSPAAAFESGYGRIKGASANPPRRITAITAANDPVSGDLDIHVEFGEEFATGFRLQVGKTAAETYQRLRKVASIFDRGEA